MNPKRFPASSRIFPILFTISWALTSVTPAPGEKLHLGRTWHVLRFDHPTTITNHGTKMVVEMIVNPKTGQWEPVWGDLSWSETWIANHLRFDGPSDDVHNGGSLKVLKPVTIALVMFGQGETEIEVDSMPAIHEATKSAPSKGSVALKRFKPKAKH